MKMLSEAGIQMRRYFTWYKVLVVVVKKKMYISFLLKKWLIEIAHV